MAALGCCGRWSRGRALGALALTLTPTLSRREREQKPSLWDRGQKPSLREREQKPSLREREQKPSLRERGQEPSLRGREEQELSPQEGGEDAQDLKSPPKPITKASGFRYLRSAAFTPSSVAAASWSSTFCEIANVRPR